MSDTPRTDEAEEQSIRAYEAERESGWPLFPCDGYDFARDLERELAKAKARIARLELWSGKLIAKIDWDQGIDITPEVDALREVLEAQP